jgi:hypothetical protein
MPSPILEVAVPRGPVKVAERLGGDAPLLGTPLVLVKPGGSAHDQDQRPSFAIGAAFSAYGRNEDVTI